MENPVITVYFSKYSLSSGKVTPCKVKRYKGPLGNEYWSPEKDEPLYGLQSLKDAFESRDAAVADANKRKARKIASLRKQIAKIEAMTF